jgi:hypothetical protein
MSSVTNFLRNPDGKYISVEQTIIGSDIPESSTFVAFDSVIFARKAGQAALTAPKFDTVAKDGEATAVMNKDERWLLSSSIEDGRIVMHYYGLGPTITNALLEYGVEDPQFPQDPLIITQHLKGVLRAEYIADGPMDLTSANRYYEGDLPIPFADVELSPAGGLLASMVAPIE